ncbi:MAG: PAS domain-containing protein [Comamonadaceae bacterium]|nr:MAG: PAS domain-containing protein [Comamonadaceae bacterium]
MQQSEKAMGGVPTQSLQQAQQLMEAIVRAQSEFIREADRRKAFDLLLADILALSGSEYGFIGEVLYQPDGQPYLKTYAITNIAWNDATREFYEKNAPNGLEFFNLKTLFGSVLTSGQPLIANDPYTHPKRGGLPEGHPHMSAFLGLPVHHGEEMVAMMGIANRPAGYDQEVIDFLRPLTSTIGQLVVATRIQRKNEQVQLEIVQLNRDLEHKVEERTRQLVQAEKMASLGQLVANVAHEINTPIGAVKSSAKNISDSLSQALHHLPQLFQLLSPEEERLFIAQIEKSSIPGPSLSTREERALVRELSAVLEGHGVQEARYKAGLLVQIKADREVEKLLPLLLHPKADFILDTAYSLATIASNTENINTAVERVSKIVFSLKSFSRVDPTAELVATNLQDNLETVLTIYHSQIKQGTELVRRFADTPTIMGLPDELNQVWTNLIHNALQAMDYKGVLTVSIQQEGNDAVVSVEDSGCGIPDAVLPKIFEPFFTTKPVGEGSGLGLDIVKKIIERHQGRIVVNSTEGQGSVFKVYLPCTKEA